MDGPRSLICEQSENRLHVQKALLVEILGGGRMARERSAATSDTRTRSGAATWPRCAGGSTRPSPPTARRPGSPRTARCRTSGSAASSPALGRISTRPSRPTTPPSTGRPTDEGALRGRAGCPGRHRPPGRGGRRRSTASPTSSSATGRLADACDVARRALELAESRGRRRQVEALVGAAARGAGRCRRGRGARARARRPRVGPERRARPAATPTADAEGRARARARAGRSRRIRPCSTAGGRGRRSTAGDLDEARRRCAESAATAQRAVGQLHAAMDACYQALAICPADAGRPPRARRALPRPRLAGAGGRQARPARPPVRARPATSSREAGLCTWRPTGSPTTRGFAAICG